MERAVGCGLHISDDAHPGRGKPAAVALVDLCRPARRHGGRLRWVGGLSRQAGAGLDALHDDQTAARFLSKARDSGSS